MRKLSIFNDITTLTTVTSFTVIILMTFFILLIFFHFHKKKKHFERKYQQKNSSENFIFTGVLKIQKKLLVSSTPQHHKHLILIALFHHKTRTHREFHFRCLFSILVAQMKLNHFTTFGTQHKQISPCKYRSACRYSRRIRNVMSLCFHRIYKRPFGGAHPTDGRVKVYRRTLSLHWLKEWERASELPNPTMR